MSIRKHHITFKDFPLESGKISFSIIQKLSEMLRAVAGGSLRIVLEGVSSKKGPKPEWLEKALDFHFTGIHPGSTILTAEAPLLQDTLYLQQIPIFGRKPESLQHYSGIDLALESFCQAFDPEINQDDLLDKHLLNEMKRYRSLFNDHKGSIIISGSNIKKPLRIESEYFKKIKHLEAQTPPSAKARITGVLDLMQFSKDLIQINTEKGIVRALLTSEITFSKVSEYFGEKVMIEGLANYKPSGSISAIEVSKIRLASNEDQWFGSLHPAIKEQMDFKELRVKQKFEGTALENVIGHWPGNEPIEDLLEMRNK